MFSSHISMNSSQIHLPTYFSNVDGNRNGQVIPHSDECANSIHTTREVRIESELLKQLGKGSNDCIKVHLYKWVFLKKSNRLLLLCFVTFQGWDMTYLAHCLCAHTICHSVHFIISYSLIGSSYHQPVHNLLPS